jgi:hypothetical protein
MRPDDFDFVTLEIECGGETPRMAKLLRVARPRSHGAEAAARHMSIRETNTVEEPSRNEQNRTDYNPRGRGP